MTETYIFTHRFFTYFLLIFCIFVDCEGKYGYVLWSMDKMVMKVTDYYADIPDNYIAKATYSNEINTTGWAFLEIDTSADATDEQQAYAAGVLEGFLTRDLIWFHWQNMLKGYCYDKTDVCALIDGFLDANEAYVDDMVKTHPKDPYWHHVKLYFLQLDGIAFGYNQATKSVFERLTIRDILWINMLGDLDELAFALSLPPEDAEGHLFSDHCTGLVKLLPGLEELYTSQVTWNSYQSMLRFQKMYILNFRVCPGSSEFIPGRKMALSSYPGFVQSTDDFYIISSGLVPAETTIGNSNRTLFLSIKPKGTVFEYARAMVANRLAKSGKEWADIYSRFNSGTYNNQWYDLRGKYIVDYNKFKPRTMTTPGVVQPGVLWVVEQLPGYVESKDITGYLLQNTYFASFNIPFFPRVFNLSGGNERIRVFGDWFGYETNPRAKIIKQKQATITNLRDMFYTMRYCDFKNDPLSRCQTCNPPYSACNTIAARNDLNPANGSYPFRALGHRSHGATDAKVTSSRLARAFLFVAIASPPHNISRGIPPFSWSSFDLGRSISHVGHPDLWMFPPIVHRWEWA